MISVSHLLETSLAGVLESTRSLVDTIFSSLREISVLQVAFRSSQSTCFKLMGCFYMSVLFRKMLSRLKCTIRSCLAVHIGRKRKWYSQLKVSYSITSGCVECVSRTAVLRVNALRGE